MTRSSSSSRHIQAGLLGLEYTIAAMSPAESSASRRARRASAPLWAYTSKALQPMPSTLSWDFWIGKPGSMKSTLSLPGIRWVQAMNAEKEPATEPVVGMQPSGLMSRSIKALTKRLAAALRGGYPSAAGYWEHIPESRACFSARMPYSFIGRPGEPWSIRMKGMPVFSSR